MYVPFDEIINVMNGFNGGQLDWMEAREQFENLVRERFLQGHWRKTLVSLEESALRTVSDMIFNCD